MESQKAGENNDYIINKKIEEKEETRINNSKLNEEMKLKAQDYFDKGINIKKII